MATITRGLSDERASRLEEMASRFGLCAEYLMRLSVEEMLARPDGEFERAVDHVLKKNAELSNNTRGGGRGDDARGFSRMAAQSRR